MAAGTIDGTGIELLRTRDPGDLRLNAS